MRHGRYKIVGEPGLVDRKGLLLLGALREVFLISLVVGLVLVVICQTSTVNAVHSSSKNQITDLSNIRPVRNLDYDRDREQLHVYSWPSDFNSIEIGSGMISQQHSPRNLICISSSERNSTTAMLSQRFGSRNIRHVVCIVRHGELLLSEEIDVGKGSSADVRISADASMALVVGHEGAVFGWDLSSVEPIRWEFQLDHSAFINGLSPDGRSLFAAAAQGDAGVYDSRTGELKVAIHTTGGASRCSAWSSDGQRLATAEQNGDMYVFNAATGEQIWHANLGFIFARSLAFSTDGNLLAVGGFDKRIRLWNLSQPAEPPIILDGDSGVVHDFAFISDSTFVSGSDDGTILEWSLATRKISRRFR